MNCIRVLLVIMTVFVGAVSAHAQAVSGQGTWESTLQARDVGNTGTTNAFYDTALNITWLRDANMNGQMDWNTAMSWASNLTVGGVSGWRLPLLEDTGSPGCTFGYFNTDCGFNVQTSSSEMAHLFYGTLGNRASFDTSGVGQAYSGLTNSGPFLGLQSSWYWSDTLNKPVTYGAWYFNTSNGLQDPNGAFQLYAMAVHPGDVGAVVASVPEPETDLAPEKRTP